MSDIWVHLPVDERNVPPMPLAPRPKSLQGLKVGLLENGKEFSQEVHEGLEELLKRDYGVADVKFWHKGFPTKAAPFVDEIASECDAAVSGVGHWGSSSPWSVHDAVALEKLGLPTVTLISCSFFSLGQAVGRQLDYPGLPIILLPHPIGDTDIEKVRDKGRDAAKEAVRLLTTSAEAVAEEYMTREFPIPEFSVPKF